MKLGTEAAAAAAVVFLNDDTYYYCGRTEQTPSEIVTYAVRASPHMRPEVLKLVLTYRLGQEVSSTI